MPIQTSSKRIILGILLVLTLVLVYFGATHRWFGQSGHAVGASQSAKDEHKPVYWYDAMNPQHHYNHPGKVPGAGRRDAQPPAAVFRCVMHRETLPQQAADLFA